MDGRHAPVGSYAGVVRATSPGALGLALPGVQFLPHRFRPMFDKHAGTVCSGAQIHITDRATFRPFQTGLRVIEAARRLAPLDFHWRTEPYEYDTRPAIDLLTGLRPLPRHRRARGKPARRDHAALRGGAAFPGAAGALPALSGSQARRRRVRRRPRLGQDVGHRRGRSEAQGAGADGRHRQALDQGRRGRCPRQGLPAARRRGCGRGSVRHARAHDRAALPRAEPLEALLERDFSHCDIVIIEGLQVAADSEDRSRAHGDLAARHRRARGARVGWAVFGFGADALLRRLGRDRRDGRPARGARPSGISGELGHAGRGRPVEPRRASRRTERRRAGRRGTESRRAGRRGGPQAELS